MSFNPFNVEMIRLDYDVKEVADALRKKSLPESFAQMLLQGVPLESINKEDAKREKMALKNNKLTLSLSEICEDALGRY